jgi:hypothetical protein
VNDPVGPSDKAKDQVVNCCAVLGVRANAENQNEWQRGKRHKEEISLWLLILHRATHCTAGM